MNSRPIVAVTCCWVAGVSVLSLFQRQDAMLALIGLGFLLIGFGLLGKLNWKLLVVCVMALLISGGERMWLEHRQSSGLAIHEVSEGNEALIIGYISSVVEVDGDLVMFQVKSRSIQLGHATPEQKLQDTMIVRIKLNEQREQQTASNWRRGDRVRIKGELEKTGTAGNFGAFDYRSYLEKRGIYWQLSAKGTESVTVKDGRIDLSIKGLRILDHLRDEISALMDQMFPNGDSGYMKGLVVGIRSDLNPKQFDDFALLGLTHVLAISGLHVGVIVVILLQFGAWMRLTRERTLELTIAFMPVYMLITGASPSAVRACLMAMLALWLARRHALKDGLHLLSAAALLMLMWNPMLIAEVSFQLSFIVTAGLLLFVPTVTESLPFPWKWLRGSISVTVTAQAVSFPLTAYYFHSVHLLSLPANFFLVPFISFIVMPLGMASIVLGAIWLPLGIIPAKLATLGNQLTFAAVEYLSRYNELRTVWPQPSLLWVTAAYVLMGAGIYLLKRKKTNEKEQEWWLGQSIAGSQLGENEELTAPLVLVPSELMDSKRKSQRAMIILLVAVMGWLLWGFQPSGLDRSATVSFINVGQGDSILIRTGAGKHILIDTGGTVNFRKPGEEWRERSDPYEVGRKLLVPLLLKRGVRELDALVLTHMDADHIGGAAAVMDQIPVRTVLFNGTVKGSPVASTLFQLALDKGVSCYSVNAPMEWVVDSSTKLSALYPSEQLLGQSDEIIASDDQNDRSIVLLINLYGRQFLFPGDLESKGEQAVVEEQIKAGNNMRRNIDVLKAGHHGSKTSTTQAWLNYWKPQETVISVGLNNVYRHPHPTVMQRLVDSGGIILRTDLDGEIQYRISPGGRMERRTMLHV
jgi:competence protein ComEC